MEKKIECCNILGVNVSCLNMDNAIKIVTQNIDQLSGKYICVSNVHTTVMSYEDAEYRNIQNSAAFVFPDGKPLSNVAKKRGYKNIDRVTGPDFMEKICEISNKKKYRHYFYGSTDETLKKLKDNLIQRYSNIEIVGMYSPPFRKLTEDEDKKIINEINETKPDFVWIGLGAPKQEIWMYKHQNIINGLMIGVGAAFDYHAGNIKRAPMWMQKHSLEWIYRLIQAPGKLFGRYMSTNFKFIWNAVIRGK